MKKIEDQILATGEILYEGRIYPNPHDNNNRNINFNPTKWFAFWRLKAEEIKKSKLSYDQIQNIHREFTHEMISYAYNKNMVTKHQELNQLVAELTVAFELAYSNYRDSKGKFLSFLIGFFAKQIKDLPMIKNSINTSQ